MAIDATNLKKVSGIQTFPASVIVKYFIRPATRILTTIIIMILQAIALSCSNLIFGEVTGCVKSQLGRTFHVRLAQLVRIGQTIITPFLPEEC